MEKESPTLSRKSLKSSAAGMAKKCLMGLQGQSTLPTCVKKWTNGLARTSFGSESWQLRGGRFNDTAKNREHSSREDRPCSCGPSCVPQGLFQMMRVIWHILASPPCISFPVSLLDKFPDMGENIGIRLYFQMFCIFEILLSSFPSVNRCMR